MTVTSYRAPDAPFGDRSGGLSGGLSGDGARGRDSEVAWFLVIALTLTVLAIAPLAQWYRDMDPTQVAVNALHAATCAVGASIAVYRTLRPCLLVASVFPYCWLVVASAFQLAEQQAAWGDPGVVLQYSESLRAQLILCVGQVALLAGYALSASRRNRKSQVEWTVSATGRSRLLVASAVMLLGAAALVPLVISAAGGVGALFASRQEFNQALSAGGLDRSDTSIGALIKIVPSALAAGAAILALWTIRNPAADATGRRRAWVFAVVAGLLLLIVANPFAYTRYVVLASFGSVALAFFRPRGRGPALIWLGLTLTAFLLVYPLAEFFRRGPGQSSASGPMLASKDFDGFQQTINTVSLVTDQGITWGHHLISGLFFFVPRAIWTDKAVPSAFPVAQDRGYLFQNLSEPLPAEAYLDLGWFGVVLVLGLMGYAWHVLDRAWGTGSRLSVVAAYVALAQVGMWRGPFGSLVPIFGFTIGLLVLVVIWSSLTSDSGESSSGDSPEEPRTGGGRRVRPGSRLDARPVRARRH